MIQRKRSRIEAQTEKLLYILKRKQIFDNAFSKPRNKGKLHPEVKELIVQIRKDFGYSSKTIDYDIWTKFQNVYKQSKTEASLIAIVNKFKQTLNKDE